MTKEFKPRYRMPKPYYVDKPTRCDHCGEVSMFPCPPRAWRWAEVCPGFKRAEDRFYGAHNRAGITYAPSPTRGRGEK
jgi:hypothetical protein